MSHSEEKPQYAAGDSQNNKPSNVNTRKPNYVIADSSHKTPSLLSYIAIFLGLGWIITLVIVLFSLPVLYYYEQWKLFTAVAGVYLLSILYPVDRYLQPSWGTKLGSWMVRESNSYFSFKLECEDFDALQKAGPALYISEPHGVFPLTMFWGTMGSVPGQKMLCCLSSTMYKIPLMKHFLTWAGSTSIDKNNIISHLKKGYSLQLCAGGLQEIAYWGDANEYVLFLKSRLGVTKLALTNGVPIVPEFTFGLRSSYDQYIPTVDTKRGRFILWCGRKIGFFPMIFLGLGGVPWGQPKPCKLVTVVGTPIRVPKTANPTQEEIEKYHAMFLKAMVKLYNDNRAAHGCADIPIRIV